MPKFLVSLEQKVLETTVVEVEADTPQQAVEKALEIDQCELDWQPDHEAEPDDMEAYAVNDEAGDEVWNGLGDGS